MLFTALTFIKENHYLGVSEQNQQPHSSMLLSVEEEGRYSSLQFLKSKAKVLGKASLFPEQF